jgi:uncharacterized protein
MNPPPTLQQRLAERQRPSGAVVLYQRWEHLLFLHWKWDAAEVQQTLPPGLTVDKHEGAAWLGLVPLFMRDVRPRFVPAMEPLSNFFELNVRTYVYDSRGRPGLWFYSLDCDQPLLVEAARNLLHLPYEHCKIRAGVDDQGWVEFEAERGGMLGHSRFRYRGFGPEAAVQPESTEFFLLERYRLFAADRSGEGLRSVSVCHAPYQVRQAQVFEWGEAALRLAGFDPKSRAPDHLCVTDPLDVETFAPEAIE